MHQQVWTLGPHQVVDLLVPDGSWTPSARRFREVNPFPGDTAQHMRTSHIWENSSSHGSGIPEPPPNATRQPREALSGPQVISSPSGVQWKLRQGQKNETVQGRLGEGNDTPLQYSCLENPRDGGAWWAAVYGVAQSRTWLKQLSSSSSRIELQELQKMKLPLELWPIKVECNLYAKPR